MLRVLLAALLLAPLAAALPTPGINGDTFEPVTGRIFPEALQTNDYVGYEEAVAGLKLLEKRHPDRVTFREIGTSVGWVNPVSGQREPSPLFAVEVTNKASPLSFEQKLKSVFFLSIHGNEKGGREGGLRAIEDLAAGVGIATEVPETVEMLDYQALVFVFANADGWRHEEIQYRAADACYVSITCGTPVGRPPGEPGVETQNFVRVNGNGIDLNRQFPTVGFLDDGESWKTLSQPESHAMATYLKNLTRVVAGADIHGMLNHDHYFLIMLKDGQRTQRELFANEVLAESLKERINANPYYRAWAASPHVAGAWGGEGMFAEWKSTIDSIGYAASGTAGAFIVQDIGLNAPGFTIEMAYNHIAVDNYYPGAGAVFNDYHVRAVRDTVLSFMDFASKRAAVSIDTKGERVAWLATDFVATNKDDDKSKYAGWFVETDKDDAWDLLHAEFEATPNEWFHDLASVARDGERPGVVTELRSVDEFVAALGRYDTIAIPGSAAQKLDGRADALTALKGWIERGGNLLLTDEALRLLVPLGLVPDGSVDHVFAYSGYTDLLDRSHPVATGLRGSPRQTYDPNPLGFAPGQSPVWFVARDAWKTAGGEEIGIVDAAGDGAPTETGNAQTVPTYAKVGVNLGTLPVGSGRVHVFGAILPDPTEETLHPYGLDGHAVSAGGNVILLNLLGYGYVYDAPPIVLDDLARIDDLLPGTSRTGGADESPKLVPAPGALLALLPAAALFALRRR